MEPDELKTAWQSLDRQLQQLRDALSEPPASVEGPRSLPQRPAARRSRLKRGGAV